MFSLSITCLSQTLVLPTGNVHCPNLVYIMPSHLSEYKKCVSSVCPYKPSSVSVYQEMSSNEVNEMTTDSPTEDPKQLYRSETKTSIERHTVNEFDTEDEHEGGFWAWATVVSA